MTPESFENSSEAHARTTELFTKIRGLEKRSLASKYLHFHVPGLFFIYDARAIAGMRKVMDVVGRATRYAESGGESISQLLGEMCPLVPTLQSGVRRCASPARTR